MFSALAKFFMRSFYECNKTLMDCFPVRSLCIFICSLCFLRNASPETITDVQRLFDDKFSPAVYNPLIRGQNDLTQPADVNVSLLLRFVQELNDLEETFEALAVLFVEWIDERLTWSPEDYNKTKEIYLPADKVWRPELTLENPATTRRFIGEDISRIPAKHAFTGLATLVIAEHLKSGCAVDLRSFPWDTQICAFNFVLWGYQKHEARLHPGRDTVDLSVYQSNGQWVLIDSKIYEKFHPLKSFLIFEFKLRRRPEFFVVNILLPIVTLGLLNLVVFIVPVDSGERVSFSLTILLSIAVFMTLVSGTLPANAETIPAMCYLLLFVLVHSTLTCCFNIISVNVYFKDNVAKSAVWKCRFIQYLVRKTVSKQSNIKIQNDSEDCVDSLNSTNGRVEKRIDILSWKDISKFLDKVFFGLMVVLLVLGYIMFAVHVIKADMF